MKKFQTESGSTYELDEEGKKIRRLSGTNNPTNRQGQDGDWRSYEGIVSGGVDGIKVGEQALIVWVQDEHEPLTSLTSVVKTTLTSVVVSVNE